MNERIKKLHEMEERIITLIDDFERLWQEKINSFSFEIPKDFFVAENKNMIENMLEKCREAAIFCVPSAINTEVVQ